MKKTIIFLFLLLIITSTASAEIICKQERYSSNLVFYRDGKQIAKFIYKCGSDYDRQGEEINGTVKELGMIHGPIYDKTYVILQYKNNRIVDGSYEEYYLPPKFGSKKSKDSGEIPAGTFRIKNGKPDGLMAYRYRSGKPLFSAFFSSGKPVGTIYRYYENGTVYSERKYNMDGTSGEIKEYHKDGKLQMTAVMKDCKQGAAEYFGADGRKINFTLRASVCGALSGSFALFSIYLAVLGLVRVFKPAKPGVVIAGDSGLEKAVITPDKKRNRALIFLSLAASTPLWALIMLVIAGSSYNFACGKETGINGAAAVLMSVIAVMGLALAWYFLSNLDGTETLEFDGNSLYIGRAWAGFRFKTRLDADNIIKISPVIIDKETGEQYFSAMEIQGAAYMDSYAAYLCATMKNDQQIIFAKCVGKAEADMLVKFLKGKMPGLVV
jgi:antitoxin component YwqK of YwqJK toxin-antitoxin module